MVLLRSYYDDEYSPEYGTLVIRGRGASARVATGRPDDSMLDESFSPASPSGTIARSGADWLQASSGDTWVAVTLELHDAPPETSTTGAAMDTSYVHTGDGLALDCMTGSDSDSVLAVPAGVYRVRVSTSADERGSNWILQFWPVDDDQDLSPRWLRRHEQPEQSEAVPDNIHQARHEFGYLAADLVSVAAWSPGSSFTVGSLARQCLVSEASIRAALHYAVRDRLLEVHGDVGTPDTALRLTPLPSDVYQRQSEADERHRARLRESRRSNETQTTRHSPGGPSGLRAHDSEAHGFPAVWARHSPEPPRVADLPLGEPLKAGVISGSGELFTWRGGRQETLSDLGEAGWQKALATPHGIVAVSTTRTLLVRPDGSVDVLLSDGSGRAELSEDGRYLAIGEHHFGRSSWSRLHVIDLVHLTRQTLPKMEFYVPIAVHGEVVHYSFERQDGARERAARTVAGELTASVDGLQSIDAISGAMIIQGRSERQLVWGSVTGRVPTAIGDSSLCLSRGARWFYKGRHGDRAGRVVDLIPTVPSAGEARTFELPKGVREPNPAQAGFHVWESDNSLVMVANTSAPDVHAVRLDVTSGAMEAVSVPGCTANPTLVAPGFT